MTETESDSPSTAILHAVSRSWARFSNVWQEQLRETPPSEPVSVDFAMMFMEGLADNARLCLDILGKLNVLLLDAEQRAAFERGLGHCLSALVNKERAVQQLILAWMLENPGMSAQEVTERLFELVKSSSVSEGMLDGRNLSN